MRFTFFAMAGVAALAACGTPYEQCVRKVSAEVATLDRLIAETEANIARGYAVSIRQEPRITTVFCTDPASTVVFCERFDMVRVEDKIAIDPDAEARKLANLRSKRRQAAKAVEPQLQACAERHG